MAFNIRTARNLTEFEEETQELSQELNLVDVEYNNGIVVSVFNDTPGDSRYSISEDGTEFRQDVDAAIEQGLDLVDVEYIPQAGFIATYADNPGNSTYSINSNPRGFIEQVDAGTDQGFDLINVEYLSGTWIAAYGQNPGSTSYYANDDFDEFTGQLQTAVDRGRDIVDIEYAGETWFATYGSNPGTTVISIAESGDEFLELSEIRSEQGYDLIDVEYFGDSNWIGVFDSDPRNAQTTTVGASSIVTDSSQTITEDSTMMFNDADINMI